MNTVRPPQEESVIEYKEVKPVNRMAEEIATVMVPNKVISKETDWMALKSGYVCKFRKVPPFAFAKARSTLRRVMRDNKPEPPTVTQGNRQVVNNGDPYYIAKMSLWESEWEDLQRDIFTSTSILVGIVLRDPVPDKDEWLPFIMDVLGAMEITEDEVLTSFKYSEQKTLELLFKEYVLLSDPADMTAFNDFINDTGESDEDDDSTGEVSDAIDSFRSETE